MAQNISSLNLFRYSWYWCYYPHQSRDPVSTVCGILFTYFMTHYNVSVDDSAFNSYVLVKLKLLEIAANLHSKLFATLGLTNLRPFLLFLQSDSCGRKSLHISSKLLPSFLFREGKNNYFIHILWIRGGVGRCG